VVCLKKSQGFLIQDPHRVGIVRKEQPIVILARKGAVNCSTAIRAGEGSRGMKCKPAKLF